MSVDFEVSCYVLSIYPFSRSVTEGEGSFLLYYSGKIVSVLAIIHQKGKAPKLVITQQ